MLNEKALEAGLEAYNKFECGSDVDHVRSIVAGYLSAILPEDAAGLVERLIHAEPGRSQAVRNEAASLIQSQAAESAAHKARIVELEAALKPFLFGDSTIADILWGDYADDAPMNMTVPLGTYRAARSLLNGERKG